MTPRDRPPPIAGGAAPPSPAARHAPAAARNRAPLLEVLRRVLPVPARVLEVASGTGEHAVHFAAGEPGWQWLPSDVSPEALASIEAHRAHAGLTNLRAPRVLDVHSPWGVAGIDAVVAINLLHVAPWSAAEGLMRGAAGSLGLGGRLCVYGPFRFHGVFTAPSNQAFDRSLRARDPEWGVRDVNDLSALARPLGLHLAEPIAMPANNHVLCFERTGARP